MKQNIIKEQRGNNVKKHIREKGKLKLGMIFQELKPGNKVSIARELSEKSGAPEKMNGRTGIIESKRGLAFVVKVREQGREKRFIIKPIHLKKLK